MDAATATAPLPPGRVARLLQRLPAPLRSSAEALPGSLAPPVPEGAPTPRIAVIGAGFGGIGTAVRLRQAGIESFTIHEKSDRIGGTWRDNTYPGAACDVPSHLYSLSFAPKTDWSRKFPPQHEILEYLEQVVDDFGVRPHVRFGSEITEARWDDGTATWTLTFADGGTEEVDVVVAATGQLNRPYTPPIAGLDDFAGVRFHSARWDHDHDLTERDVAVVGIGASAIQFVPEVAKVARSVTLFQRSVNYVAPKPDGEFSEEAKARFARHPWLQKLYRASIWVRFDMRWVALRRGSRVGRYGQDLFQKRIGELVSDELPAEAIVPDYPLGCRRILISNDWYPTLLRPNVSVVTDPVERVVAEGVVAGGTTHRADTLIFGTGFESTGFLVPMRITGRGGVDLREQWRDGAEAHLGMTVTGFPNLFVLYGPNTNLGHNSIVFMIERQIAYVLTAIRTLMRRDLAAVEVRPEVEAASNRRLADELEGTVWAADCHSWYKTETGRITNNWAGPTARYWLRTARLHPEDFRWTPRAALAAARERVAGTSTAAVGDGVSDDGAPGRAGGAAPTPPARPSGVSEPVGVRD